MWTEYHANLPNKRLAKGLLYQGFKSEEETKGIAFPNLFFFFFSKFSNYECSPCLRI